jgi:hypothetical protein
VAHALYVLEELNKKSPSQFPAKINIIGWSRGAVTTIKLANAIHAYFVVGGKTFKGPEDFSKGYKAGNVTEILMNASSSPKISATKT